MKRLFEVALLEAKGDIWEVTIIKAGKSLNGFIYPEDVLKNAIPLFENIPVFAHRTGTHIPYDNKSTQDIIGIITEVEYRDGALKGKLNILPSATWLKDNLLIAKEKGLSIYELSIDARGQASPTNEGVLVASIDYVDSVDLVPHSSAGGKIEDLQENYKILNEQFKGVIKMETINEKEILKENPKENQREEIKLQEALNEIKLTNCKIMLDAELRASDLPVVLQEDIRKRYEGKIFNATELQTSIQSAKELMGKLKETLPTGTIKITREAHDKVKKGLLGLLIDTNHNPLTAEERKTLLDNVPPMRSLKEAYIALTGDEKITGLKKDCVKLSEALDNEALDRIFADTMNRALAREYSMTNLDTWKAFADIVPRLDFRPNHIIRIGGYGAPPTVEISAAYPPLSSPTNEQASYTVSKKGGTETIPLETIKNDDVGAFRMIPRRLARAAAYGLYHTIYHTMLRPAGAFPIYDGVTLYNANHPIAPGITHSNTGTTALATGLAIARTMMLRFPERNNNIPLGIRAGFVLVPPELEDAAYERITLSFGQANQVPTNLQSQGIKVITVPIWADTNDYAVVANPTDVVGLEVGFLDGNDTPEVIVPPQLDAGSWFTNDCITLKLKFVWGVCIKDWRAFYGQIVP